MQTINPKFKTYALIVAGILLFGLLVFGLEKLASQDAQLKTATTQTTDADTKIQGDAAAKVTLLEYSDFQCPACAAYEPLIANLHQDFPTDLKIVYRYFPLETIHKNALVSAEAAEAAHRQGKFWEMHDQLFQHQAEWAKSENPTDMFQGYAQAIGLNMDQFNADSVDTAVAAAVKSDEKMGTEANIPGTPSFFLDGKKLENPQSYEAFKKIIEDELARIQ